MDRRSIVSAPHDGTPVHLIVRDATGEWTTPSAFAWRIRAWCAVTSGLPIAGHLAVVGWVPAEKRKRKG